MTIEEIQKRISSCERMCIASQEMSRYKTIKRMYDDILYATGLIKAILSDESLDKASDAVKKFSENRKKRMV